MMHAAFPASLAMLLLLPSAAVAQTDVLAEFRAGQTSRFSSQGHAKSRGVNLTIRYPRSWRIHESDRPHIVQNFVSTDASGSNCNVAIRDSGMSNAQARAAVKPEALRTQLPADMVFISGQATTLDRHPASEVQGRVSVNRAGTAFEARALMFVTVEGTQLLFFTCLAGGPTAADADRRFATYLPLFRLMANSIVFPDQYR